MNLDCNAYRITHIFSSNLYKVCHRKLYNYGLLGTILFEKYLILLSRGCVIIAHFAISCFYLIITFTYHTIKLKRASKYNFQPNSRVNRSFCKFQKQISCTLFSRGMFTLIYGCSWTLRTFLSLKMNSPRNSKLPMKNLDVFSPFLTFHPKFCDQTANILGTVYLCPLFLFYL